MYCVVSFGRVRMLRRQNVRPSAGRGETDIGSVLQADRTRNPTPTALGPTLGALRRGQQKMRSSRDGRKPMEIDRRSSPIPASPKSTLEMLCWWTRRAIQRLPMRNRRWVCIFVLQIERSPTGAWLETGAKQGGGCYLARNPYAFK